MAFGERGKRIDVATHLRIVRLLGEARFSRRAIAKLCNVDRKTVDKRARR